MIQNTKPLADQPAAPKDTRFKPGQSGNPTGRPKGSRTKALLALDKLGEDNATEIVEAMIQKAKEGDVQAGRAILERVWPPRKGACVEFNLPPVSEPGDVSKAIGSICQQVAGGELSPDEGGMILALLETLRKAIETEQLAERIAVLERMAGKK